MELSLNGKPVPNITFEVENSTENSEGETFVLESQSDETK
jgi:hypothetical protein